MGIDIISCDLHVVQNSILGDHQNPTKNIFVLGRSVVITFLVIDHRSFKFRPAKFTGGTHDDRELAIFFIHRFLIPHKTIAAIATLEIRIKVPRAAIRVSSYTIPDISILYFNFDSRSDRFNDINKSCVDLYMVFVHKLLVLFSAVSSFVFIHLIHEFRCIIVAIHEIVQGYLFPDDCCEFDNFFCKP